MARNCEKHFVRLNRVFLEEQWNKEKEKKRPPLHKLNSASEVKKWIPSIKREMNYCLQQLSGARKHDYSEAKFKEFEERVQYLENEYKRFVKRVFELDPSTTNVPWEARAYKKKRKNIGNEEAHSPSPSKIKAIEICPALLDAKESISLSEEEDSEASSRIRLDKQNGGEKSMKETNSQEIKSSLSEDQCQEQSKTSDGNCQRKPAEKRSIVAYDASDSDDDED